MINKRTIPILVVAAGALAIRLWAWDRGQKTPASTAATSSWGSILCSLGFLVVLLVQASQGNCQTQAIPEYKWKAGYLFNFAQLIEWPTNAAGENVHSIVIGVMGGTAAISVIEMTLRNRTIKGMSFVVKAVRDASTASGCNILFVTREITKSPAEIRQDLGPATTLLVGEADGFVENAGMIGFVPYGESFRFTLNMEAVARAGLKVDPRLARVAVR